MTAGRAIASLRLDARPLLRAAMRAIFEMHDPVNPSRLSPLVRAREVIHGTLFTSQGGADGRVNGGPGQHMHRSWAGQGRHSLRRCGGDQGRHLSSAAQMGPRGGASGHPAHVCVGQGGRGAPARASTSASGVARASAWRDG